MTNLLLQLCCAFLAFMHIVSCRAFESKPEVYAHRDFKSIRNIKNVTGDDLIKWAEGSTTTGPFRKIPYILVQELKINSNPIERQNLANSYEYIYRKLISGAYGQKRDSIVYEGGEERLHPGIVNVKDYAYLYQSVPRAHLKWAESGEIPMKGSSELKQMLMNLDAIED